MSKWTPRPWRIEFDRNEQANIYGPEHEWVALCPHQCVGSLEKIAAANAALIAAAPSLLEALKACVSVTDNYGMALNGTKAIEQARAAIALTRPAPESRSEVKP